MNKPAARNNCRRRITDPFFASNHGNFTAYLQQFFSTTSHYAPAPKTRPIVVTAGAAPLAQHET